MRHRNSATALMNALVDAENGFAYTLHEQLAHSDNGLSPHDVTMSKTDKGDVYFAVTAKANGKTHTVCVGLREKEIYLKQRLGECTYARHDKAQLNAFFNKLTKRLQTGLHLSGINYGRQVQATEEAALK